MASEIRVNSLSSRTGLSTVTFTDTGPIFSGITTFQDNSGFNVGTGGSIFSPASNTVTLGTNNAERLRITSAGKVGIGTDNPNSAAGLDVLNGEICARGIRSNAHKPISGVWLGKAPGGGNAVVEIVGDTGSTAEIDFTTPNTDTKGRVGYDLTNDYMYFYTNGANERVRITSGGLVGIGTQVPGSALEVFGSGAVANVKAEGQTNARVRIQAGNTSSSFLEFGDSDDADVGEIVYDHSDNHMHFNTNAAERLRITSDGKVGINRTTPVAPITARRTDAGGTGTSGVIAEFANSSGYGVWFGQSSASGAAWGATTGDFYWNTGGLSSSVERLRITSGGDLLLGGQTAYTYDDTGASNTILDIANSTNNKRGILSLSGNSNANGPSIGTIWFNNDQNSGTGPGGTMKLVAAIQAKAVTSDSNAGDDSGAYLQFLTKPESAALAESMVIHSDGEVTKVKQPGFFTRRAVGGDGRSGGAQEWSVSGTGSFNTGSHFNASNGRFTAPIAGKYLFTAAPGYKQTGQDFQFYFRINGTDASEPVRFIDGGDDLTSHSLASGSVIYNLSANDYVDIYVGTTHHVNLTLNYFMGYLLG